MSELQKKISRIQRREGPRMGFSQAVREPHVQARLEELGFVVNGGTPAEFQDRVRSESQLYQRLIEQRKLTVK